MTEFVPGIELSRSWYDDIVRPVLDSRFPGLPHAAALLGRGSEVLGFDDAMSTDHDWKPRVLLYITDEDDARHGADLRKALQEELPETYAGHPAGHEVHTIRGYLWEQLAVDVDADLEPSDWLTMPEHALRMLTSGAVFHDAVGLRSVRDRFAYYPRDVWLYLLVTGWWRVHPEMNLVGRAGSVDDELGSSLIASRLVTDLMRLGFLMERVYAPYSKWFGTAFSRLPCGPELTPVLWRVGRAETWQKREESLMAAYSLLIERHDALGLTARTTPEVVRMWERPFQVAWADIPEMILPLIEDPAVLRIADRWPVGPVDQFRELSWPARNRASLKLLFDEGDQGSRGPA